MKILSFGRSALSTTERIKRVIELIKQSYRLHSELAVVVSAMAGVTDVLLEIAKDASKGIEDYRQGLVELKTTHMEAAASIVAEKSLNSIYESLHKSFHELQELLHGVYLVREISPKTLDLISGFGELWAAEIVAGGLHAAISHAAIVDAKPLIRTDNHFGCAHIQIDESCTLIRTYFEDKSIFPVITGFVGSTENGDATTLGRGSSDLTAVVFAIALGACEVDIWSERNGVMTTDPVKVPHAYPISTITYKEALELSHFGAKIIYPPAIALAQKHTIPIRIRNPALEGSVGTTIVSEVTESQQSIRGISAVDDVTLVRLEGAGLVGVPGIATRIFETLSKNNISVIMIALCSSEHSISFAVSPDAGTLAKNMLEKEFYREITSMQIDRIALDNKKSIIGVVGENMHDNPGISGRLFSCLGRNGINVIAITQGSSEQIISFVVDKDDETKTLQVLHEEFFVTRSATLNIFLAGVGKIGGSLLSQFVRQAKALRENEKIDLHLIGIANSKKMVLNSKGIELTHWREALNNSEEKMNVHEWVSRIKKMNLLDSVVIDCSSSQKLPGLYGALLDANISVIASNLRANIGSYHSYLELRSLAHQRGAKYLYEASVGDGVPVLNLVNKMLNAGDRITSIEAVLSPFTSKVLADYPKYKSFSKTVQKVYEECFPYLDPRDELCGKWTANELLVLARESGRPVELEDILITQLIPEQFFAVNSIPEFFDKLVKFDPEFHQIYETLCSKGEKLVYLASFNQEEIKVELIAIGESHPLFRIPGGQNVVIICSERYRKFPLIISGQSSDPETVAGVVFADVVRTAIT